MSAVFTATRHKLAPMREIGPGESIAMLALPDVSLAWETVFA